MTHKSKAEERRAKASHAECQRNLNLARQRVAIARRPRGRGPGGDGVAPCGLQRPQLAIGRVAYRLRHARRLGERLAHGPRHE